MRFYFPITKVDAEAQMVWGYASTEAQDDQGEIVRRAALEAALGDYMKFANIREMHQLSAVGRATEAGVDDKGLYIGARVVDPRAWDKVTAGVYNGFSIGGRVTARDPADRTVITGLALNEISLVDRPANPEAVFDCWKAAPAPTEGALAYADPGYRADGKRRYPIDSAERIRAAWAYIHHPANAARYTATQLAQVKERIVAAWKDKIDPAGPPAAGKGVRSGDLRKGLGEVARLAALVAGLDGLCDRLVVEAAVEGDASPLPARLQAIVDELCDLLNALAAEETAELRDGDEAPQPGDFVALSATRGSGDALLKARADNARLARALDEIVPRLDHLAARVEAIAAAPLPPLTRAGGGLPQGVHGLAKAGDSGDVDIVAALARMTGEERTLTLIKAAHANPLRPLGPPLPPG